MLSNLPKIISPIASGRLSVWQRKTLFLLAFVFNLLALSQLAQAATSFSAHPTENQLDNVIINEVGQDGRIELYNGTTTAVDVSSYWLCNFPAYRRIGDATNITIESGNLTIQPGEYLVVSGFSGFDADDAELGLYLDNSFGNAASLVSYLEYGSSGHRRSGLAIANGFWSADFFLTPPTTTASIQTFVDASDALSWSNEMPTFGAENEMDCNITTNDIMLDGGGTETSICVDGNPDPLTVVTDGGMGDNNATGFIITNTEGLILGLQQPDHSTSMGQEPAPVRFGTSATKPKVLVGGK